MRAFVTGVAGFAGSHLAELLLERGFEIWGLVPESEGVGNLAACLAGPHAGRLHRVSGELGDEERLRALFEAIRPERIYHLAAVSSVRLSQGNPAETFRVNVLGTQAILRAARSAAEGCRLLYVSSAEVYGESAAGLEPLTEEAPLRPLSPYAASKAAAELLAVRAGDAGQDVVRVRPFPHTGPRHAPTFVFPDVARQLAEIEAGRRPARLEVGDLGVRRDLSDVRDMVRAYALALEAGEQGAVYNLCSGRVHVLREVLDRLVALAGVPVEVTVRPERLRPHDLPLLAGSSRAFRERTGWAPVHPLDQTLTGLLAYWREQVRRG